MAATTAELNSIPKEAFSACFQQWRHRWEKCVECQGNYFEGDQVSNAPSKPVSFSRPKVGYFSNRPRTWTAAVLGQQQYMGNSSTWTAAVLGQQQYLDSSSTWTHHFTAQTQHLEWSVGRRSNAWGWGWGGVTESTVMRKWKWLFVNTVELHVSGRCLSGSPFIRTGLALRVN